MQSVPFNFNSCNKVTVTLILSWLLLLWYFFTHLSEHAVWSVLLQCSRSWEPHLALTASQWISKAKNQRRHYFKDFAISSNIFQEKKSFIKKRYWNRNSSFGSFTRNLMLYHQISTPNAYKKCVVLHIWCNLLQLKRKKKRGGGNYPWFTNVGFSLFHQGKNDPPLLQIF